MSFKCPMVTKKRVLQTFQRMIKRNLDWCGSSDIVDPVLHQVHATVSCSTEQSPGTLCAPHPFFLRQHRQQLPPSEKVA